MVATKEKTDSTREIKSYRSLPLAAFRIIGSSGINLYCLRDDDPQPVLLQSSQQALTSKEIDAVQSRGHKTLYVRKQDFPHISKKLLEMIDSLLVERKISIEARFALLQVAYAGEIERLFRKAYLERYVGLAREVSKKISTLLQQGEVSTKELFRLTHQSDATYSHVSNVAAYAVALAKEIEAIAPEDYDHIAFGCMLHEVGKLYLPAELLAKKSRLTIHDRQELEKIPQLAYEALYEIEGLNHGQLMMAYQHCEWMDGTGYPVRTLADDIHPWAKLLSVVDVFDTITSEREYCSALNLRDALLSLADGAKTQFEPEMVLCWITSFQLQ